MYVSMGVIWNICFEREHDPQASKLQAGLSKGKAHQTVPKILDQDSY